MLLVYSFLKHTDFGKYFSTTDWFLLFKSWRVRFWIYDL